jgi:uncharacterized RDD family membrane protein YckC
MQSSSRQLFLGAALAIFFTFAFTAIAQDPKSATPPATAPADQPANAATDPAAADPKKAEPPLRRLEPPADATPTEPATSRRKGNRDRSGRGDNNERVAIGHDASLGEGEAASAVVAIFGSATSAGRVDEAVVSILGDTRVTGPVGDAAVAVLGNAYVNSRVGDAVVAVLGNIELGPQAEIMGDVVSVGGTITRHPDALVHGDTQNVAFGHMTFGEMNGLRAWFRHAVLLGRPLAIGPDLGWAWMVAFSFLALYVVIALLFRPAVAQCTATLETRPGYSILTTVLTVLLIPVTLILLCVSVVGIALVPFVLMGLLVTAIFGKVVMLGWLGSRFTRFFGDGPMSHVAVAVLLGGLVILGLYLVPFLGFLVFKLLGWIGIGVVIYTLILRMKREARPVVAAPGVPGVAMAAGAGVSESATFGQVAGAGVMGAATAPPPVVTPPLVFAAATLPRAGFWPRLLAMLIDIVVVAIFMGLLLPRFMHGGFGPGTLPIIAIYAAVLWKLRGTTIGGIVCGLKVVRLDERPIDWPTAIVRALGCFLSLVVGGLGFIWVAFDAEKQSWHDKIAGTTVVRVPKGVPLV